ncbi:MAG: hypothetical protein H0U74_06525 [Bradymonadaceae bacterium]|nr:hypothetical protein [Lujinxingiaceae bacterium]
MRLFLLCALLASIALPSLAAAAEPMATRSLSTTLDNYFTRGHTEPGVGKSLALLAKDGARLGDVLSVELLESQRAAVVEVELVHQNRRLRYPVKLTRAATCEPWQLAWVPAESYTRALLNLARSGALPTTRDAPAWAQEQRLVAFPIIVTRQQYTTPFGDIVIDAKGPAALATPEELARHAQRWVRDILESAPAPAGIDLIVDARVSWRTVTSTLMAAAAVGFYRVHLITNDVSDGAVCSVVANSPIFEAERLPANMKMLVVAMYPITVAAGAPRQLGFRIALDEQIFKAELAACDEEMSFCATTPEEFATRFDSLVNDSRELATAAATHVIFATLPNASLQTALDYMLATARAMRLDQEKVFMGFIQK